MQMDNEKEKKAFERMLLNYDRHCVKLEKATQAKNNETAKEKTARIKLLEGDYISWWEYYFPHYAKCKSAPFHATLANAIIKNKKIRMLAEMYRGSGKSVHNNLGIPLYLMYVKKDLKFMLLVGATDIKAKKLIGDVRAEFAKNEKLKNDYGNKQCVGDWAEGDFVTTDGVRFQSFGFGSDPRGSREGADRPDYISVDDVDGKKHIANDRIMGEAVDYIEEDVIGCFDTADDCTERFVFSNNNFHKNSITNRLKKKYQISIKKSKQEGDKPNEYILTVCAVVNMKDFKPTWPEKTSAEYWRKKYNANSRSFKRERMHIHVVEGKMFKAEFMQWKKMLKLSEYECLVLYGDWSYKDQGDYKAMVLLGKIGREFHNIKTFLRQTSRSNAAKWLYDLYEDRKLFNYNIIYKIEGLFAQDEFINDIDEEGDLRNYYIPVISDKRPKEGKYDRVESIVGFFEKKFFFWNEAEKDEPEQVEAIEQFTSFEKGSKSHDDYPDAVQGGIREIQELSMPSRSEPQINKRNDHSKQPSKHRS
jgi:hypothetical protein